MRVKRENDVLVCSNKSRVLSEILDKLASKDSKQVANYLVEHTNLPRELRTNALRLVLNEYVKIAKELVLSDEFMHRLKWYDKFSEYQLVNFWNVLATKNADKFDAQAEALKYKKTFYLLLFMNAATVGFADKELDKLLNLATPDGEDESFQEFMDESNCAFYDYDDNFDGMSYDDFKDVLKKSSTVADIRNLAAKYDIKVPKRLKKDELLEIVADGLRRQGEYDEETEAQLKRMTALTLQRYAKTHGINASTEMKKADVIDYVMNNIDKSTKAVHKPRVELVTLPELEEFVFTTDYLREVNVKDEDDVVEDFNIDDMPVVKKAPVVEDKPAVEETPVVEENKEEQYQAIIQAYDEKVKSLEEQIATGNEAIMAQIQQMMEEKAKAEEEQEPVVEENKEEQYQAIIQAYDEKVKSLEEQIATGNEAIMAQIQQMMEEKAKAEEEQEPVVEETPVEETPAVVEDSLTNEDLLAAITKLMAEKDQVEEAAVTEEDKDAQYQALLQAYDEKVKALENQIASGNEELLAQIQQMLAEKEQVQEQPVVVEVKDDKDEKYQAMLNDYENRVKSLEEQVKGINNQPIKIELNYPGGVQPVQEKPVVQEEPVVEEKPVVEEVKEIDPYANLNDKERAQVAKLNKAKEANNKKREISDKKLYKKHAAKKGWAAFFTILIILVLVAVIALVVAGALIDMGYLTEDMKTMVESYLQYLPPFAEGGFIRELVRGFIGFPAPETPAA